MLLLPAGSCRPPTRPRTAGKARLGHAACDPACYTVSICLQVRYVYSDGYEEMGIACEVGTADVAAGTSTWRVRGKGRREVLECSAYLAACSDASAAMQPLQLCLWLRCASFSTLRALVNPPTLAGTSLPTSAPPTSSATA